MEFLPVELLSKIMVDVVYADHVHPVHCWGPSTDSSDTEVDSYKAFAEYWLPVHRTKPRTHGPLQLGLVCRLWRHTAADTAMLWNRLAVNLDDVMDSPAAESRLIDDLRRRLEMSKQAPLHILVVLDSWERLEARRFREILDDVLRASHRWASLQMRLPSEHWSILLHHHNHNILDAGADAEPPLARLTHVSLTNLSLVPIFPSDEPLSWRSLTHLVLEGVSTRDIVMPLSSVTHLRLVDSSLQFPWPDLAQAQRLAYLVLDNCGIVAQTYYSSPPGVIVCSSVRHFTYHPTYPAPHVKILEILVFPALEEFVLTEDTTSSSASAGLLTFISSCGHTLRRFVLREDPYNTHIRPCARVVEMLSHLPKVEYVELEFQYVGLAYFDEFFERLTSSGDEADGPFLPNLRALQFNSLHGISWPLLPSIFNMSTSHRRPLLHLTVKNMSALDTDRLTPEVIEELLVLCDRGVEICLFNKENERLRLEDLC